MKGNNFFHRVHAGLALAPQSVGAATVNGATITEPWKKGRQLALLALLGAISATSVGHLKIQGLKRSDGVTWEALKENDGVTDLKFSDSNFADADDNTAVLGTLDLTRIDGETYKAIRVVFTQDTAAQTFLIAVGYIIYDVLRHPSGQTDDLFTKQTGQ